MSAVGDHRKFGTELCAALGLPADKVLRIEVVATTADLPIVTVTLIPEDARLADVRRVVDDYELRPRSWSPAKL